MRIRGLDHDLPAEIALEPVALVIAPSIALDIEEATVYNEDKIEAVEIVQVTEVVSEDGSVTEVVTEEVIVAEELIEEEAKPAPAGKQEVKEEDSSEKEVQ